MTKLSLKELKGDRPIQLTDAELEKIRGGMSSTKFDAIALKIIGTGRGGGGTGGSGTS